VCARVYMCLCLNLYVCVLDLSVQASGQNMGQVYTDSGKIRGRYISGSVKIRVGCISVLLVSDQPNGFRTPFRGLFLFFVKIKNSAYLLLKIIRIQ